MSNRKNFSAHYLWAVVGLRSMCWEGCPGSQKVSLPRTSYPENAPFYPKMVTLPAVVVEPGSDRGRKTNWQDSSSAHVNVEPWWENWNAFSSYYGKFNYSCFPLMDYKKTITFKKELEIPHRFYAKPKLQKIDCLYSFLWCCDNTIMNINRKVYTATAFQPVHF